MRLAGLVAVVLSMSMGLCHGTVAQQISFRTYGQADGLSNLDLSCLRQNDSGYILGCTDRGLYAYDGRRFLNLGPAQGLPEGGIVQDVAFGYDGRIIVRYSDRVFVSDEPLGLSSPPARQYFRQAASEADLLFSSDANQLVPWSRGAVFIDAGHLQYVDPGDAHHRPAILPTAGLLRQPAGLIRNAQRLAAQGTFLWTSLSDGRICQLGPVSEHCFDSRDGLPQADWVSLLPSPNGHLLARSLFLLADIDPAVGRAQVTTLPQQGGRYLNYSSYLALAWTPSGQLLTQSQDGLMVRQATGWKMLTTANGLPSMPIFSVLFDHENDLWLAMPGRGALRALGYGLWENRNDRDGLSSSLVWQITRQPSGPLWVATDGGVDVLDPPRDVPVVRRHYDLASFAIASNASGHVWRSIGASGVSCIVTRTGEARNFALPPTNRILRGAGARMWFITEKGIYFVDDAADVPAPPQRLPGFSGSLTSAAVAADGSLWLLRHKQLLHLHADGTMVQVERDWPQAGFDPLTLATARSDTVWVGGSGGGLYRVDLDGDRVLRTTLHGPGDVLSDTVVAVLVDHRGWIWAGTDSGISVFDGARWVSAAIGDGLIWNDVDQAGLFEDSDGSIWVGTSQGLSHLLDPARLFHRLPLQPVISFFQLGNIRFPSRAVAYTRGPLSIDFSALNFHADGAIRFRYRLEGVDESWADTPGDHARYPSLPPGHHRFSVVAYDPLTHQVSLPASILLRMKKPWWLWWPFLCLYVVLAGGLAYGIVRARTGYLLRQRRALQQEVELRTREIREMQAQDSLTKLLTRGEIQSRLVGTLARAGRPTRIAIGLLDIDHFKRINDQFGHLAGDEILKEIGQRLRLALRPGDYAGRYGGEEILIVLDAQGAPTLDRIAELDRAACGKPFLVEGEVIRVTCSIGFTQERAHDDWKSLIGRADKALYRAKAEGRNRIIVAPTESLVI